MCLQRHSLTGTPLLFSTGQQGCLELRSEMSLRALCESPSKNAVDMLPTHGSHFYIFSCMARMEALCHALCSLLQSNEML